MPATKHRRHGKTRPLLVKVAPDLDDAQIEAIAEAAARHGIDGLIATNTTLARDAIAGDARAGETGGLSGRPLFARSTLPTRGGKGGRRRPHDWHAAMSSLFSALQNGQNLTSPRALSCHRRSSTRTRTHSKRCATCARPACSPRRSTPSS